MPSIINATTTTGVAVTADNSGSLQLATNNGTTAVTIDTSQNVGIGTASPSTKLDVAGIALIGTVGNNAIAINSSGANYGFISNPSSGVFGLSYGTTIGTLGTSVATWNSSGNFAFNSGYGSVATAYGCRAWVNFNGTTNVGGNCTIRASANVSSVADNGTGDYTVNLTTAMPDGNYSAVSSGGTGGNNIRMSSCSPVSTTSTSQIRVIGITSGAASLIDLEVVSVAIFR